MGSPDLYDLSQTSQDLDIELDIGGLALEESDITSNPDFKYPAIVISDVVFQDVIKVLNTRCRKSYRAFDVWLDGVEGGSPVLMGTLPLELETLLVMRYLGVRVTAYFSSDRVELLDLSDTDVLEKYM